MKKKKINYIENLINNIFSQAEKGKIQIENGTIVPWSFYVKFHSNNSLEITDDAPIVIVQNKELFFDLVEKYLIEARKFDEEDKDYFDLDDVGFDEKLVMDLIVNCNNFDLENIEQYIQNRILMLQDKTNKCKNFYLGNYLDYEIIAKISKNKSNLEAPFKFSVKFKKEDEAFVLPSITFGTIADKTAIYAIQGAKEKQENSVAKKLDRHFRKANKGVDMEDEILSQVSTNALVALTVFMSFLKDRKTHSVEAVNFMPLRYSTQLTRGEVITKNKPSELAVFQDKHDKDQFNISNRFLYTLIRYCSQFNIEYQFDDIYEKLTFELNENQKVSEDNILFDIENSIAEQLTNKGNGLNQ